MAQKRSEKIYQIITLEELCGALFGAEDGEKCLMQNWVDQTKFRRTHGKGGAKTRGGKAFRQQDQIEIFLPEKILCDVWSDPDRSELWSEITKGTGKNPMGDIVLARGEDPKAKAARRELAKWLKDDADGSRYEDLLGHCRNLLEYGESPRLPEALDVCFSALLEREKNFEETQSQTKEAERRKSRRERWRDELSERWTELAHSREKEKQVELLSWMILYAVLTIDRIEDLVGLSAAAESRKRGLMGNPREEETGRASFLGSIRRSEVTVTYANRSDSMSEDIINLAKESREVCGIGIALSELTGMGMVLTKILEGGTKFRLLLTDPEGEGRRLREIEETGAEDGHIVQSVKQARENMKILREMRTDLAEGIRIRYYQETPRANLIFFDDRYALIQFYYGKERGKETPSFLVKNGPGCSIFGFYKKIFDDIWEESESMEERFLDG